MFSHVSHLHICVKTRRSPTVNRSETCEVPRKKCLRTTDTRRPAAVVAAANEDLAAAAGLGATEEVWPAPQSGFPDTRWKKEKQMVSLMFGPSLLASRFFFLFSSFFSEDHTQPLLLKLRSGRHRLQLECQVLAFRLLTIQAQVQIKMPCTCKIALQGAFEMTLKIEAPCVKHLAQATISQALQLKTS